MNATLSTQMLEIGLIVLLLAVVGIWLVYQHHTRQSLQLQRKFGAEYGRTVIRLGSRTKAEQELRARQRRVERLKIVPLEPADAERFIQTWNALQVRFVDDPRGMVSKAHELVREVMQKRGYPVQDFERSAADISVHHPAVVENYRLAQGIAARDEGGKASTEDLRKALVHYRALFDELMEVWVSNADAVAAQHDEAEVHS